MKRTFQPKKRTRSGVHGFLVRSKSKSGRNVLRARRSKGRAKLTA
ncbi:MAG: 50S ribosomal protein L34 [Oscillospiraceae bacterium]|nr:50S ribosomal protein L34 [Oscillospiraceae bacterium]